MKLTTIALGALAAVATLTGGANAQPNLRHRQLIQVTEPVVGHCGRWCQRTLDDELDDDESVGAPIWPPIGGDNGWTGRDEMDDESVGAQIGWYGDEMDMFSRRLSRPGKAIPGLSLEQWEARKPNRQANRANRQARQAKRQVRKQTRQNRVDVWKARKPIRQAKRENRQGRKVIRQNKLAQYKAKKRAQRKAIWSRRLRTPGLSLEQWEARKPNRQANRANRQARQAKRQVRKQTRQNRLDVWKARKPIRQVKRANRQVRKVIRQYIRQRSEQHRGRQSGPVV